MFLRAKMKEITVNATYLLCFMCLVILVQGVSISQCGLSERNEWIGIMLHGLDTKWRDWNVNCVLLWLLPQISAFLFYSVCIGEQIRNMYLELPRLQSWNRWWWKLQKTTIQYAVCFAGIVCVVVWISFVLLGTEGKHMELNKVVMLCFPAILYYFLQLYIYMQLQMMFQICFRQARAAIIFVFLIEIIGMYTGAQISRMHCWIIGSNSMWKRYGVLHSNTPDRCIGFLGLLICNVSIAIFTKLYLKKRTEI